MGRPRLPIGTWGEIYPKELPTGQWMARAQFCGADGNVRTIKRHGPTKPKARQRLLEALADARDEAVGGEISRNTRLDALAELFFGEEERLAGEGLKAMSTVDQYRDHYTRHITKPMGQLQLFECESVSRNHNFLVSLSSRSNSTAVMCRKVLSVMYKYAVIHKAMRANPIRDVGKLSRKPKKKPRALEAAQIKDWLNKLDESELAREQDLRDISRILLATGGRISEVLALSWADYSSKAKTIKWSFHMVYVKGQGNIRVPNTKGVDQEKAPEPQDLPDWAVDFLDERRKRFGPAGLIGPIFPHPVTRKYRDPREVGKVIRNVRGDAGYPWLTSHQLGRKTVATILDEGGATAREIADQLRHARPSMTQDVYMARDRANKRTAKLLNATLSPEVATKDNGSDDPEQGAAAAG
jgi:integrase